VWPRPEDDLAERIADALESALLESGIDLS
jgi:hypothetical protein